MTAAFLEHVNMTVVDPDYSAKLFYDVFDWKIRWQGDAIGGGRSVHVGSSDHYIALYTPQKMSGSVVDNYHTRGGLNHIAIVVDDLDEIEKRVEKHGYKTHSHGDYEPGRRFYFHEDNAIEIEVVSY